MEIRCIASGSHGNAYTVSDGESTLLLEAGIHFSALRRALDFGLHTLAGCLVSHSHADHAKAAEGLLRARVEVYMSAGTAAALSLSGRHLHTIRGKERFTVGSFDVLPFDIVHDAPEGLGFLLRSKKTKEKLLFFTDTADILYRFSGVNYFLCECNYDDDVLRARMASGSLAPEHYRRLVKTHMGLRRLLEFLSGCDLQGAREVWLLHLSEENSDEAHFREAVGAILPAGTKLYIPPKNETPCNGFLPLLSAITETENTENLERRIS